MQANTVQTKNWEKTIKKCGNNVLQRIYNKKYYFKKVKQLQHAACWLVGANCQTERILGCCCSVAPGATVNKGISYIFDNSHRNKLF